jgi:hypothetical protein
MTLAIQVPRHHGSMASKGKTRLARIAAVRGRVGLARQEAGAASTSGLPSTSVTGGWWVIRNQVHLAAGQETTRQLPRTEPPGHQGRPGQTSIHSRAHSREMHAAPIPRGGCQGLLPEEGARDFFRAAIPPICQEGTTAIEESELLLAKRAARCESRFLGSLGHGPRIGRTSIERLV